MAADSADQVSTPDRYERLAELVDAIDSEGTQVTDTDTRILHDDTLRATIEVEIDEGRLKPVNTHTLRGARTPTVSIEMRETEEALEDADVDAQQIVDELEENEDEDDQDGAVCTECGESHDDGACWDEPDDADEENRGQASISSPCNGSGDKDDTDDSSGGPDLGGAPGDVLAALREEGELSASALETITGVGSVYNALRTLGEDDLIEKRDDPQDGRRTLYRPADWLVDGGEQHESGQSPMDPETVLAESGVPDRHSLDAVLDAVEASNTVYDAAQSLDIAPRGLEEFCQRMDLKEDDSRLLRTGVEERVASIRQEVEG